MAEAVTRARLIEVAIDMFGRNGPDSVTTRAIADAAGAQQSAISYHFGTKDRLYLACAEHIAATMRAKITPLIDRPSVIASPAEARSRIEALVSGLVVIMMHDDIAPLARFVVREQMNPTPAFAVLYDRAIRHAVEAMTDLLGAIAGERLSAEQLHVRCIALLGQVFGFRFARAALLRMTAWESVGPHETELVRQVVVAHTRAVLTDLEMEGGS